MNNMIPPQNRKMLSKWYKTNVMFLLIIIFFILNFFDLAVLGKDVTFDLVYDIVPQIIVLITMFYMLKKQKGISDRLKDSEQRYQSLFQYSSVGIYVLNQDGTINSISPSLLDLLGYTEEEIINKPFVNFFISDELLLMQEGFMQIISGNKVTSSRKITLKHKSGECYTFEASSVPLMAEGEIRGMIGFANDITELERMQEKLAYMQTEMNNIFESIDVVLWSADVAERKLITISSACEKVFGYPPEDFYQSSNLWLEMVHSEDKAFAEQRITNIFTTSPLYSNSEFRIHHTSGEIRWVESRMFPEWGTNGEPVGLKGVVIDITQKKKIEENRQKDLDLARLVQKSVLSQPIITPSLSIDARYIPSQQLGGDMYAWYRLDEHRYGIVIMDVMGNGISSSLICMSIRSLLEGIIRNCLDPELVVKELNDHMYKLFKQTNTSTSFFFTAIYLVVDQEKQCIEYINAGHTPGLLMDSTGVICELESTCVPIGLVPDLESVKRTVHYDGPSRIILYTDGLIESPGILLQEQIELLKGTLKESISESLQILMDKLIEISKFSRQEAQDDICLVCIEMQGLRKAYGF